MRIKFEKKEEPKIGDVKQKVKFLMFPKILEDELRWLEFAKIEYVYSSYLESYDKTPNEGHKWVAVSWIPDKLTNN